MIHRTEDPSVASVTLLSKQKLYVPYGPQLSGAASPPAQSPAFPEILRCGIAEA